MLSSKKLLYSYTYFNLIKYLYVFRPFYVFQDSMNVCVAVIDNKRVVFVSNLMKPVHIKYISLVHVFDSETVVSRRDDVTNRRLPGSYLLNGTICCCFSQRIEFYWGKNKQFNNMTNRTSYFYDPDVGNFHYGEFIAVNSL